MVNKKSQSPVAVFQLGDRVKIRHAGGKIGRVAELRGPLGPGGMAVYRVLVGRKPHRTYIELLADQLDAAPKPEKAPLDVPGSNDANSIF